MRVLMIVHVRAHARDAAARPLACLQHARHAQPLRARTHTTRFDSCGAVRRALSQGHPLGPALYYQRFLRRPGQASALAVRAHELEPSRAAAGVHARSSATPAGVASRFRGAQHRSMLLARPPCRRSACRVLTAGVSCLLRVLAGSGQAAAPSRGRAGSARRRAVHVPLRALFRATWTESVDGGRASAVWVRAQWRGGGVITGSAGPDRATAGAALEGRGRAGRAFAVDFSCVEE